MRKSPEVEPNVSPSMSVPEARGSERFWSRLRSAIPVAVAGVTMAIVLAAEVKIGTALGSGGALFWGVWGSAATIFAYKLSKDILDHFVDQSQR